MIKFICKRLLFVIPVLLAAIIVVFTINYLSDSNPAMIKLGIAASDPEKLAVMEHEMGLDRPYIVQLGDYLWRLCHGDLGDSYVYSKTVWELISARLPNTLTISIGAVIIAVLIGIPLGLIAALKQNTIVDYATTSFAVFFNAFPGFLVAIILMIVFAVKLRWFPVSGAESWKSFVLPMIAAAFEPITQNTRMTRSSVLEVIRQDYVRTAKAKGISDRIVTLRHVLKNALIPIVTMVGTSLGTCVAGAVVIEIIFNIPGMGTLMQSSVNAQDYITVQGCVVVSAFAVAIMNLLTDLVYAAIDPRIKAQYLGESKRKKKKQAAEVRVT